MPIKVPSYLCSLSLVPVATCWVLFRRQYSVSLYRQLPFSKGMGGRVVYRKGCEGVLWVPRGTPCDKDRRCSQEDEEDEEVGRRYTE